MRNRPGYSSVGSTDNPRPADSAARRRVEVLIHDPFGYNYVTKLSRDESTLERSTGTLELLLRVRLGLDEAMSHQPCAQLVKAVVLYC